METIRDYLFSAHSILNTGLAITAFIALVVVYRERSLIRYINVAAIVKVYKQYTALMLFGTGYVVEAIYLVILGGTRVLHNGEKIELLWTASVALAVIAQVLKYMGIFSFLRNFADDKIDGINDDAGETGTQTKQHRPDNGPSRRRE